MEQNTSRTKCKNSKIQTQQHKKGKNTHCQNTNVTKKCHKIQMQKTPKYKQDKIQKNKIQM